MTHFSPSDPDKYIRERAERLLILFREEQQATHRKVGCRCDECKKDMIEAFKKLLEETDLHVLSHLSVT
ncbi:MAG: hypothetical protein Q7K26_02265 [bacterium]|nr:hypothetical protein [bacterium]